jgi:hypothetical protein
MPWTPCSCSLQHTLLYFSFLKLPEEDNFRQQNRLLAILVKHHRSRRFTRTDLSCSDVLSVCLSLYPCVFLRSSLTHAQQTSHKMLYRVQEARKKFTPRSSFENQKSSTERQYATRTFKGPRKRDLLTREKLLLHRRGHRHLMGPPPVRRTCAHSKLVSARELGRRRHGTPRWTLDVPGRNSRLLVAILLLMEFSTTYLTFWHRKFHPLLSFT